MKFDKVSECDSDLNIENFLKNYIGYMYNVSQDKSSLVITNINDDKDKTTILLSEIGIFIY